MWALLSTGFVDYKGGLELLAGLQITENEDGFERIWPNIEGTKAWHVSFFFHALCHVAEECSFFAVA